MYDFDDDYDDDYDFKPRTGYVDSINRIVEREIQNGLTDKQKQLEKDYDYYKNEMWKAKQELSKIRIRLLNHEKEVEKATRESVKMAQKEYWFDCSIGDKIYIVDWKIIRLKCERCNDKGSVKILVDEVEVNAECPICGTYSKKEKFSNKEHFITEGRVSRLKIELTKDNKWITVWTDDDRHEYRLDYREIYRTREEAEIKLTEKISEEKNKK